MLYFAATVEVVLASIGFGLKFISIQVAKEMLLL
jgi:hypothetical protein